VHPVGFIIKKFVMIHGHMNVKYLGLVRRLGVKGAVCGPRGAYLAGRYAPVKIWEMPFIPAKSYACMSSS